VLSFFPLTSPVAMILRLTWGRVEPIDIAGSILVGAVSVYFALRAASKIFRAASLMYGKRATLGEVVRWLRAA
jgi:ABC-2 type transport system permease protein